LAEGESADKGIRRLEPNFLIGYTTRRHLILDIDDSSITKVERLVKRIQAEWPEVGDCLIMLSSDKATSLKLSYSPHRRPYHLRQSSNFHLIFDDPIGYNKCCKIIEVLAGLNILNADYVKIRNFRGDMTLRVSHENQSTGAVKPMPQIVKIIPTKPFLIGHGWIREYLAFHGAVLSLASRELHTEHQADDRAYGPHDSRKISPVHVLVKSDGL
jgi:hypothetical protein